jgi:hypothetical protein
MVKRVFDILRCDVLAPAGLAIDLDWRDRCG